MARLEQGYSQENVAREIGVSQSYYARLESGKTAFTEKRLYDIFTLLDIESISLNRHKKITAKV